MQHPQEDRRDDTRPASSRVQEALASGSRTRWKQHLPVVASVTRASSSVQASGANQDGTSAGC